MADFADVWAGGVRVADRCLVEVPETWHQGRTAFGGFSSALALAEAMRIGGALPPLRSAQVAMMAPLSGRVSVTARVARQGRNATWMIVDIAGDKGLGVVANLVFMHPVASTLALSDRDVPQGLVPVQDARRFANERGPAFLRNHFDVRFAIPRTPERQADVCWWVRPHGHERLDPMVALLLTGDALPPGVMPLLSPSVPVSTMHWQVNLLTGAPVTEDGWWLLRSTGDHAREGCSSQAMGMWNTAGEPMAAGIQAVALFG